VTVGGAVGLCVVTFGLGEGLWARGDGVVVSAFVGAGAALFVDGCGERLAGGVVAGPPVAAAGTLAAVSRLLAGLAESAALAIVATITIAKKPAITPSVIFTPLLAPRSVRFGRGGG
jgi:hypothetical protein